MSMADVSDAFRNTRVDPDKAHNFCYTVGELVVIDFRLPVGWSGSLGFWGVISAAVEHAHCNTTIKFNPAFRRRKIKNGPRKGGRSLGRGKTHADSAGRKNQSTHWGRNSRPVFHDRVRRRLFIDQSATLRQRHDRPNRVGLACLGSRAVVWTGGERCNPYLSPQEEYGRGHHDRRARVTINSHTIRISLRREKVDAIKRLLREQWPVIRRQAKVREVLSMAGSCGPHVRRAGRYFVERLLRHTRQQQPEQYCGNLEESFTLTSSGSGR